VRAAAVKAAAPGFSRAEALLYLCASRCSLGRLSRVLLAVTALAGALGGLALLVGV